MYVAVKGGEKAIARAHALLAKEGRGNPELARIAPNALATQLSVLVARVMNEGSLHDPELAARALIQAQGDVLEAVTLLRSYRTTLPRFGYTQPVDTAQLPPQRRISATFKDLPGGQQLGATFDYTHRLFDEQGITTPDDDALPAPDPGVESADRLGAEDADPGVESADRLGAEDADPGVESADRLGADPAHPPRVPRVADLLGAASLIEPETPADFDDPEPADLTREPTLFPMSRAERLQALARGDEGFLLGLGYSTQRGFGRTHPFAGEIRVGEVDVVFDVPELGFPVTVGRVEVTECQMINQFSGNSETPAQFTRGYGLVFGRAERKSMSMSLVDRALRSAEFGERVVAPAQDEEFVIAHADNVQAAGFVEHLKLPHYVDFQAELGLVRQLNAERMERQQRVKARQGATQENQGREDTALPISKEEQQ